MISSLNANSKTYDQLMTMLWDDPKVGTIGEHFLWQEGKPYFKATVYDLVISPERLGEYRRLLARLGVMRLDRDARESVQFLTWGSGWGGHTHHKGIVWFKNPPPARSRRRYAPIRGNWYVFQD